jgi:putative addiction module killer protein
MLFELRKTVEYEHWLTDLRDRTARYRITARVERLAVGLFGDVQLVGSNVHELRLHFGPGYRVYFTRRGQQIILLLCGGDKSSQTKDIILAKQLADATVE